MVSPMKVLLSLPALLILAASALAQDVTGTIEIERKLTKRSVTAPILMYQRGAVVQLGKASPETTLDFERSRVVVYLEGANLSNAGPSSVSNSAMQQVNREFDPDLIVVPVGGTVAFPNMDPIFHNVFSLSKTKSFDLGSYDKGDTRRVTFAKPGVVNVYCHLHPNMSGTVVVVPNRYYARADSSGHYEIHDIPPGEYTVVAWHKAAGFFSKQVTVSETQRGVANFLLPFTTEQAQTKQKHEALTSAQGSQ